MDEHQNLPDVNRLSVLAASILLVYALTPFLDFPDRSLSVQLPGFFFLLPLNVYTLVAALVAVLAAAGTSWLLNDHPRIGDQRTYQHWLLPALTAWAIGVPLQSLEVGLQWWAVFAFGGVLLVLATGFVAQGLAVIHWTADHRGWPRFWSVVLYGPLMLSPSLAGLLLVGLMTAGILDNLISLRRSRTNVV